MKLENNKLECALNYASLGWSVFPCHSIRDGKCTCNNPSCDKQGKHPRTLHGFKDGTTDPDRIREYWAMFPDSNIGCATGAVSGFFVLDLDIKYGRTSGEFKIPATVSARTGGGGEHFFFTYPGYDINSTSGQLFGPGVDIRADRGYVILPPSSHVNGSYEWMVEPDSLGLAEAPGWLIEAINRRSSKKGAKLWLKGAGGVPEGTRNDTATSLAGKIISSTPLELLESIGWEQLKVWNNKNPKPLPETELRRTWESIKNSHEQTQNESRTSQANALLEALLSRGDLTLFHDEQNAGFVSLEIDDHREIWPCRGKAIKKWLSRESYQIQKKAPGSEVIKSILAVLEGKACFEGTEIKLEDRVAWRDRELWYDLTDREWRAIRINKSGWEIVNNPPILFKRYPHHKVQVMPAMDGDVKLFLKYINVTNPEHRLLFLVFLISCFIPGFPHVMLVIFGAQGSSKSTLSKLARLLVDPSIIDVASFPNSQKELIQALAHHHFLFFDNVSHISEEQSDTLCKAITGGGHVKRELYENDEDVIYSFMRCLGMNGINLVSTRPDLLERSLLIELERINPAERKTEKELYENFEKDLPSILGGVFDVLVKAIEIQPTIKINSYPRMADWTIWGCAIAEALGYTKEEFLLAYENNTAQQTEAILNENIVAMTLVSFMRDRQWQKWESNSSTLLEKLTAHAKFENERIVYDRSWPKAPQALSRALNRLKVTLLGADISIVISAGQTRKITIEKILDKKGDASDDIDDIPPTLTPEAPLADSLF